MKKKSRHNGPVIALLLGVQCVFLIGQLFLIKIPGYGVGHTSDLVLYHQYALDFFNDKIPYIDFQMEYPPLSLVAFSLPILFSLEKPIGYEAYQALFVLQTTLLCLLSNVVLLQILATRKSKHTSQVKATAVFTLAVCILSPFLPWKFDILPALLTILALSCLIFGRPMINGVSLGFAIITKLYPLVIAPIFCIYYLVDKNFRAFWRMVLGLALSAIILIPLFLLKPDWPLTFLSYHQLRGLNIESLSGGILLLTKVLDLTPVEIVHNFGAFHIDEFYSGLVTKWLTIFSILALGVVIILSFFRFKQEKERSGAISNQSLVAFTLIALLTFILTNKVFSPQYLIWLLPFIPLLKFRQSELFLIISAITVILFPFIYALLITAHPVSVFLLNLRNILTVILLIWLLVENSPLLPEHENQK
jgi:uncharacterized membrane protein